MEELEISEDEANKRLQERSKRRNEIKSCKK
jgi:hypothetical protein